MADLTSKDLGRIYAYMWFQEYIGNLEYKELYEENPVQAVYEIVQSLNEEYPDPELKIEYNPNVDALWDIEPPPNLAHGQEEKLRKYRDGTIPATLQIRLAC